MAAATGTFTRAALFYAELLAAGAAIVLLLVAGVAWAAGAVALALAAAMAGRVWARGSPLPMPYGMRWVLLAPRGPHAPQRVIRVLQPRPGERVLEVGPGVGVHALPVAAALQGGRLDVLDVQQAMLDDLMQRAGERGLRNIAPVRADARRLPYEDGIFDGAYLVSVLGEIPDAAVALHELRRVLRPGGRLVVAELFLDPDFVSLAELRVMAEATGFAFVNRVGSPFAYIAKFTTR